MLTLLYVLLAVFGCAGLSFSVLGLAAFIHQGKHPDALPQVQKLKQTRSLLSLVIGLLLFAAAIVTALLVLRS